MLPSVWKISLGIFRLPVPREPNFRVAQIKAANKPSTTAKLELTVISGLVEPDFGLLSGLDPSVRLEFGIRLGNARAADSSRLVKAGFFASLFFGAVADGIWLVTGARIESVVAAFTNPRSRIRLVLSCPCKWLEEMLANKTAAKAG